MLFIYYFTHSWRRYLIYIHHLYNILLYNHLFTTQQYAVCTVVYTSTLACARSPLHTTTFHVHRSGMAYTTFLLCPLPLFRALAVYSFTSCRRRDDFLPSPPSGSVGAPVFPDRCTENVVPNMYSGSASGWRKSG